MNQSKNKFFLTLTFFIIWFFLINPVKAETIFEKGDEPTCQYGYYEEAPYHCAVYGYYSPKWFVNGVFIGAGPWFNGHSAFNEHSERYLAPYWESGNSSENRWENNYYSR